MFGSRGAQRLDWQARGMMGNDRYYDVPTYQISGFMERQRGKLSSSFLSRERTIDHFLRAPTPGVGEYEPSRSERALARRVKSTSSASLRSTEDRFKGAYKISSTPCPMDPQNHTIAFSVRERLAQAGSPRHRPGFGSRGNRKDLFKTPVVRV